MPSNWKQSVSVIPTRMSEKLTTLFAKLDFDTDLGRGMLYGNVGLQYLHVDQESDGFGSQTGPDLFVQATPISGGDDYNEWLPSLNMNYDFNNGHLLRLAASKTVSRPRMDDMRSNQVVSFFFNLANVTSTDPEQSAWSGSAGNADPASAGSQPVRCGLGLVLCTGWICFCGLFLQRPG